MRYRRSIKYMIVMTLGLISSQVLLADEAQEIIRQKVEHVRQFEEMYISDETISGIFILPPLYERREFRPAWTSENNIEDLFKLIEEMEFEGLNPADYHLEELNKLRNEIKNSQSPSAEVRVNYDIMLSDALVRIIYHLVFGKVDPDRLDVNWNIYQEIDDQDPVSWIQSAIASPDLYQRIKELLPRDHFFVVLRSGLKRYREIKSQGGWNMISSGSTLDPGMEDLRIIKIRERLILTGDLPEDNKSDSHLYDEKLLKAVKDFQRRYGLTDDGRIGKNTLTAMNVSVDRRIEQIMVNLERGRWVYRNIGNEFILVNIAAFKSTFVRNNEIEWTGRSQVGKEFRQTPVFKSELKYIVFNPTWTVPPTILKKDILPAIKKDISYLKRKNMNVLNQSGKVIDPATIDWKKYNGGNFPYIIRQDPGPSNALGRVKFIFPNKHFVFLHDTPSKSLFERDMRALSSGCIRVENPFQLAESVLNDSIKWNLENIRALIKSEKTQTVYLDESIPVLLLYATAFPANATDNILCFREDIYHRDKAILDGLNDQFRRKKRHLDSSIKK